jgi:hypothetical protein
MQNRLFFCGFTTIALTCALAHADGSDPAAARAQLQEGYTLKQQGKCEAAIPHFVESVRLDRHPKALMNLADCQEKLGKLATAMSHFVEARDLAQAARLGQLQTLADKRRQALEKRVSRLVVKLAKDAPPGTTVTRDGVELGSVSLNTALPIDSGKHTVAARDQNAERVYDVVVSEAETKEIEVTPIGGRPLRTPTPARATGPKPADPTAAATTSKLARRSPGATQTGPSSAPPPSTGLGGQRIAAVVTGGAGLVVTGVGGYYGLRAQATFKGADCDASNECSAQGLSDQQLAYARARNATILTVGGLVALAAGVVLWVTAPSTSSTDEAAAPAPRRLWVSADPLGEGGMRSVTLGGAF